MMNKSNIKNLMLSIAALITFALAACGPAL